MPKRKPRTFARNVEVYATDGTLIRHVHQALAATMMLEGATRRSDDRGRDIAKLVIGSDQRCTEVRAMNANRLREKWQWISWDHQKHEAWSSGDSNVARVPMRSMAFWPGLEARTSFIL